ncbi:unnamed protein product [Protopolystoma xenopodis]|uniref:Uncharacterized protein n=1 Tax=Protopolystoma xenopodis TaxID=117903 RepID=A0A448XCY4_9PLAT|nr:unnamed protein product [Protopolystoma xenopodis]
MTQPLTPVVPNPFSWPHFASSLVHTTFWAVLPYAHFARIPLLLTHLLQLSTDRISPIVTSLPVELRDCEISAWRPVCLPAPIRGQRCLHVGHWRLHFSLLSWRRAFSRFAPYVTCHMHLHLQIAPQKWVIHSPDYRHPRARSRLATLFSPVAAVHMTGIVKAGTDSC